MIAHTQLEVAIEGTTFTREGLFKLFRGQLHVFVELVLIFVFHRLPILAIGATEIVGHVIGRSAGNLCELEVVDRFSERDTCSPAEPLTGEPMRNRCSATAR